VSKDTFLDVPMGWWFVFPNSDGPLDYMKRVLTSGMHKFWTDHENRLDWYTQLLESKRNAATADSPDQDSDGNSKLVDFKPVPMADSLVSATLFTLLIGLALSLLVFVVEMFFEFEDIDQESKFVLDHRPSSRN